MKAPTSFFNHFRRMAVQNKIVLDLLHVVITTAIVFGVTLGSIMLLDDIGIAVITAANGNFDDAALFHHVMLQIPLAGMLVPIPTAIGIIIYRRRLFFETTRPDRGISLPAIATILILCLWWLPVAFNIVSRLLALGGLLSHMRPLLG